MKLFSPTVALLAALLLGGCATPSPEQPADSVQTRGGEANYKVVRVNYATDRQPTGSRQPAEWFGGERGTLSYGFCDVSIPLDHRPGELESPSIWRLEFRANPEKHVVLQSVAGQDKERFFADLAARVRSADGHKLFVFVHGYNVSFANAARRTAQISHDLSTDLGVDLAPVFYSWPSQASLGGYTVDEANIEWSQSNLKSFLIDVATRMGSDQIYVVAHSMGNRATTRALAALMGERPELRGKFREIILLAPDVDADVFKRDIAPALLAGGRPVTLYASSKDKALQASKKLHGYPRLGDAGADLTVVPGIETLDASSVETDFLGHSYYAYANSVLTDIKEIIDGVGQAAQRSRPQQVVDPLGRYWKIRP